MTTPKEHPILFSGPMVRAILDGSKTQTRRVVKPQPDQRYYLRADDNVPPGEAWACEWDGDEHNGMELHQHTIRCPYGTSGDRLWVRETWAAFTTPTYEYGEADLIEGPVIQEEAAVVYRADGESMPERWRPSIFMPRWASRILLEITDVRVQRLQDISEDDARAEGYTPRSPDYPVGWFHGLWDTINGNGAWRENPWVWAITFRRLQP